MKVKNFSSTEVISHGSKGDLLNASRTTVRSHHGTKLISIGLSMKKLLLSPKMWGPVGVPTSSCLKSTYNGQLIPVDSAKVQVPLNEEIM